MLHIRSAIIVVALLISGCMTSHSYRELNVTVVDRNTGESVPNKEVRLAYIGGNPFMLSPKAQVGLTNEIGIVKLRVAPSDCAYLCIANPEWPELRKRTYSECDTVGISEHLALHGGEALSEHPFLKLDSPRYRVFVQPIE